MSLEDAQLKHGDETQPIENPEAHLKAYRESVKIMKSLSPTWPQVIPTGCRLGSALKNLGHKLSRIWSLFLDDTRIWDVQMVES